MDNQRIVSLLLLTFLNFPAHSQAVDFRFEGKLPAITKPGFYSIRVDSSNSFMCKPDYRDVRIVDKAGKWIPHLIRLPQYDRTSHSVFTSHSIKSASTASDISHVVIAVDMPINNLSVIIENTLSERFVTLTGSYDGDQWYTVTDSVKVRPVPQEDTSAVFTINFPEVRYKYFSVEINNQHLAPYRIREITSTLMLRLPSEKTFPMDQEDYWKDVFNPVCYFTQVEKGGYTELKISQRKSYQFNKILLNITAPKYFERNATIIIPGYASENVQLSNNSSEHTLKLTHGISNAREFTIRISNNDNPPLQFESVRTSMPYIVVTSYLHDSTSYSLLAGSDSIESPNYDMEKILYDSVLRSVLIRVENYVEMQPQVKPSSTNNNKLWIWIAIAVAIISLLWMSIKMMKEIKSRSNN
jgi:hypothetical protein